MRLVLAFPLSLVALAACSGPLPTVESGPAPNPMAVDGDPREWEGALRPVPEEAGLSLGIRNDADALYLVVVAGDAWQARRVAARGLTVWLDPGGRAGHGYGVSFPVGLGSDGERGGRRPGTDGEPDGAGGEGLDQRLREQFLLSLDRLVVRRGDARQSVAVGGAAGVETAARWTDAGLTVELRVPLREGSYAVGAAPGDAIGLGLELGEVRRRGQMRRQPALPSGGGGPGGFGRSDQERLRSPERPANGTVERWMAVALAE